MATAAAISYINRILSQEATLVLGVDEDVSQLQRQLELMSAAIENSSGSTTVWVKQIRDIVFDAEDVIDEYVVKIHNQRPEQQHNSRHDFGAWIMESLRYCLGIGQQFGLRHELGNQILAINTRAGDLATNMGNYKKLLENEQPANLRLVQEKVKLIRAATATEDYQDAVQIHEDSARKITNSLLMEDDNERHSDQKKDNERRPRVISIVGMGGIGKTTLAKKILHTDLVTEHFDCHAFAYVSQNLNLRWLVQSIMNCFPSVTNAMQGARKKLRKYLQGKKYLIVLDDIWDTDAWDALKSVFPEGKTGSRLVLTTRHNSVARCASSSTNIHELGVINKTESWELFLKKTFPSSSRITSEKVIDDNNLRALGDEMVGKCHGLPLAIVVLGSLLSSRRKKEFVWKNINLRVNWYLSQSKEDSYKCSGILALSYYDLPNDLKPCFLYMSLFPEDSEICTKTLFQYWIAEGFVKKEDQAEVEDIAEGYLEELISRSLIQVGRQRCDDKRVKTCRVHDLLRDLAIAISEEDQFSQIHGSVTSGGRSYQEQRSVRRVAFHCVRPASKKQYLTEFRHARTVRSLMCRGLPFIRHNYLSSLFSGFKLLRVLEFNGSTEHHAEHSIGGFPALPEEVGELVHLRYLSLENTRLERVNLSYLRKLVNLQTLNLNGCCGPLILDNKIWNLHRLRHLYLGGIRHDRSTTNAAAIHHLGISNLTDLQLLRIEAGDWIYGGGLKTLDSLKKLRMDRCSISYSDAVSDAMVNLRGLRSLMLISETPQRTVLFNTVSKEGIPLKSIEFSNHTDLKKLHLKGALHGWRGSISLPPNLCKLILEESRIETDPMPILEKLQNLIFLRLGFKSYVGKEMGCSPGGFSSLQTLTLVSLEELEEWTVEKGALKKLTQLEIVLCRKMVMLPIGVKQLTSLQKLTVNASSYTSNQWLEEPKLVPSLIRP